MYYAFNIIILTSNIYMILFIELITTAVIRLVRKWILEASDPTSSL